MVTLCSVTHKSGKQAGNLSQQVEWRSQDSWACRSLVLDVPTSFSYNNDDKQKHIWFKTGMHT